eukprot:snap_masked-scaffold_9-processed-gene-4.28-mRNA-1 protein AED:1.00 eAED:1.00 QI:0/0/0/0/1/1/2/0/73
MHLPERLCLTLLRREFTKLNGYWYGQSHSSRSVLLNVVELQARGMLIRILDFFALELWLKLEIQRNPLTLDNS